MTMGSCPEPRGTWGLVLAGAYLKGRSLFDRLRPRPLLPVAHRPIVSYPLHWLAAAGVQGITVCMNGESQEVRRAVEAEPDLGCPVAFLEDPSPRGTAGAARDAALATGAADFLVVNATAIPGLDPRTLLESHRAGDALVTVLVRREAVSAAESVGLGPTGIYVFRRRAFEYVPALGFQDIKETLLTKLHAAGERVATREVDDPGLRVLSADTYLAANESLIPRAVRGNVPAGFHRLGQALVHASARVSPRARLVGPVIVGPVASIEEEATVVGPTAIGTGSEVGPSAVVSRSVLWDACAVGAGSLVDRSVVADGGFVSDGAQLYRALRAGPERTRHDAGGPGGSAPHPAAEGSLQ
jgi:NDP-sugar pyrophosphorylase family protein